MNKQRWSRAMYFQSFCCCSLVSTYHIINNILESNPQIHNLQWRCFFFHFIFLLVCSRVCCTYPLILRNVEHLTRISLLHVYLRSRHDSSFNGCESSTYSLSNKRTQRIYSLFEFGVLASLAHLYTSSMQFSMYPFYDVFDYIACLVHVQDSLYTCIYAKQCFCMYTTHSHAKATLKLCELEYSNQNRMLGYMHIAHKLKNVSDAQNPSWNEKTRIARSSLECAWNIFIFLKYFYFRNSPISYLLVYYYKYNIYIYIR